jgi:hypothetical protein
MAFDFIGKITNINLKLLLNAETLNQNLANIHNKFDKPIEVKILRDNDSSINNILVKSTISVTSFARFKDEEFNWAINTFKAYLDEIAVVLGGEVNKNEGFYNDSKTYGRLYN